MKALKYSLGSYKSLLLNALIQKIEFLKDNKSYNRWKSIVDSQTVSKRKSNKNKQINIDYVQNKSFTPVSQIDTYKLFSYNPFSSYNKLGSCLDLNKNEKSMPSLDRSTNPFSSTMSANNLFPNQRSSSTLFTANNTQSFQSFPDFRSSNLQNPTSFLNFPQDIQLRSHFRSCQETPRIPFNQDHLNNPKNFGTPNSFNFQNQLINMNRSPRVNNSLSNTQVFYIPNNQLLNTGLISPKIPNKKAKKNSKRRID